ncbi:hypothetical protein [Haloferula sp. BvORR071]|uniref:hypothetical protein n=1 Tax=Haloferula sp. BvORR071 TaxID=1396141 RepID=UPI000558DFAC|nr:hypothetical protein [Haloferula sp. BvORR071]
MPKKLFVTLFVVLAIAFVPILISFGLVAFTVPTVWGYVSTFAELARFKASHAFGFSIHCAFYTAIFYGLARLAHAISVPMKGPRIRLAFQCVILAGIVLCSFLRVITYSSFGGQGGTYTFWGALERFIEKRHRL